MRRIVVALIITIVSLELVLRGLGLLLLAPQARKNTVSAADADAVRIVAIGESTTSDALAPGPRGAWPRQLEDLLRKNGVAARVYNVGEPAATSAILLRRLPEQLDRFQPEIVIAMMGINDRERFALPQAAPEDSAWFHLRIFNVFRWTKRAIAASQAPDSIPSRDFSDLPAARNIIARLRSEPIANVQPQIDQQMRTMTTVERAQFLEFLSRRAWPPERDPPSTGFRNSFELARQSVATYFSVGEAAEHYVYLMHKVADYRDCLPIARRFIAEHRPFSDYMLHSLSWCAADEENATEWLSILGADKKILLEQSSNTKVRDSLAGYYRKLHEILSARRINLIAMQYPLLDVGELRENFRESAAGPETQYRDIQFVGNRENFREALRTKSFDELFIDRFAGVFGHTTDFGHRLLAASACRGVSNLFLKMKKIAAPLACDESI